MWRRCWTASAAAGAARGAEILGASVANQRATLVPLDGAGAPLGPALSWQDMRGGPLL